MTMPIPVGLHPPKVRLTIRVGVTGHRPNGLGGVDYPTLRERVRQILTIVRDVGREIAADPDAGYDSADPAFRVVSPLAEGSDRIVAEEAVSLGFELQSPLPFPRAGYEQDFVTTESREKFRELLGRAKAVLELDGSRESEESTNRAYESVGRAVLRHCDVLIAIWNGERPKLKGGTAQMVGEAMRLAIPTLWIDTKPQHASCLLAFTKSGDYSQRSLDELPQQLRGLLCFPPGGNHESSEKKTVDLRSIYFREKHRSWTLGVLFDLFSKLVSGSWPWPLRIFLRNFEEETREEWQEAWAVSPGLPAAAKSQTEQSFLLHYAWADKLANYAANAYRSSFLLNYLLSACAVLFALRAYFDEGRTRFWVGMELGSITLIIALTTMGRLRRWHERWIDYRLLAEKLRQMRFLFLISRVNMTDRLPEDEHHGNPRKTWVHWHFQAVLREAGLLGASFDPGYRVAYRKLLTDYEIRSQIDYHFQSSRKFHRIDRRVRSVGTSLFFGTLLVCIVHLFDRRGVLHKHLTQLAAALPAFGGALHGIVSQGDFNNVSRRSVAVGKTLTGIMARVDSAPDNLPSDPLGDFAERAASVMGEDLLDWRAHFQDKPLEYPG